MKYLALSAVAALVISCQNESHTPPPVPSTTLASVQVDVPGPISEMLPDLIPTEQNVSAVEATTIELESGVVISIPEHSFVHQDGTPVTEHVDLLIEDMTSLGAIMKSGIRMDAKMPNGEYGTFQTAGMISINPVQDVRIAPGKSIGIKFPTKNTDEDFDFWKLDEQTNEWVRIEKSTTVNAQTTQVVQTTSLAPTNTVAGVSFASPFMSKLYDVDKTNWVPTFTNQGEYASKLLDMRKGWLLPEPMALNRGNPLQSLRPFRNRKFKPLPELSAVSPLYFVAVDSLNKWNLDQIKVNTAQMLRGSGDYYVIYGLTNESDSAIAAKVRWSYTRMQGMRRKAAYKAYTITLRRADSTILEMIDLIEREYETGEFDDELYLTLRRQCELYIERTPTIEQRERSSYLYSLIRQRANLVNSYQEFVSTRRGIEKVDEVLSSNSQDAFRDVSISSFGVYNCDRFWRVPANDFAVSFNTDSERSSMSIYLIDINDRAIVNLGLSWSGEPQKVRLQTKRDFVVMGIDNGSVFVGKLNTIDFTSSGTNEVELISTKNEAELEKILSDLG